jgi:tetratricopeptide (TPR) repeat protein
MSTNVSAAPSTRRPVVPVVLTALIVGMIGAAAVGLLRAGRPGPSLASIRALARARNFDRAMELLQVYLRAHPDDAKAHLLMGQIATDLPEPRPEVALEHLATLHPQGDKEAARVRFFEGKAQYFKGRYDLAEAAWNDALRLDPVVPEAGWALMDLLDKESRGTEAHELGMRLVEVEPDPLDRGRILLDLARQDIDNVNPWSQVNTFGPLAREHPENLALSLVVGQALIRDSQGAEGLEILEAALRRNPDSPNAWDAWLTGLNGAFDYDRLTAEFAHLPKAMANDSRFAEHEGMVAEVARDWPRAVRAYRRATVYEPSNGILWYRYRAALRQGGDAAEMERVNRWYTSFEEAFKKMRAAYDEAVEVPTLGVLPHPELYHRLADLRERMGRPDEARAWHRLILRDDPSDAVSQAALARLK